MKKLLHIIFLLSFCSTSVFGQSNVEFENYNPIWSTDINFEGLENTHLVLNDQSILFDEDNDIYALYNLFGSWLFEGYVAYKIGYYEGDIHWESILQSQEYNTRTYAQKPILKDNKYSVLINYEYSPNPSPFPVLWNLSYLGQTAYSQVDGSIVDTFATDPTDTLNKKYVFPLAPVGPNLFKTLYQWDDDGYSVAQVNVLSESKVNINLNNLDENGHVISTSSDSYELSYPIQGLDAKFMKNGDISFFCYATDANAQGQVDSIELRKYLLDKNLNTLSMASFSDIADIDLNSYRMFQNNEDPNYYLFSYSHESHEIQEKLEISKYDESNNLLENFILHDVPSEVRAVNINDEVTLIYYSLFENQSTKISIFLSDGNSNLSLVKTLNVNSDEYRTFLPSLITTPNNDLLLTLRYKTHEDVLDNTIPFTQSWHLLKGEDFIMTSTVEQEIDNLVTIRPNPSSDVVHLSSSKDITDIAMYTINGAKLSVNIVNNTLDISMYPQGIYYLQIYSKNQLIGIKRIVKNNL